MQGSAVWRRRDPRALPSATLCEPFGLGRGKPSQPREMSKLQAACVSMRSPRAYARGYTMSTVPCEVRKIGDAPPWPKIQ